MSRPVKSLSLDAATSTGPGEVVQSKSHSNVLMFLIARNVDTVNDTLTVELQHSPNEGEDWGTLATLTEEDIDGETATEYLSNVAVDRLRAEVTEFEDSSGEDLSVDVFVQANGNPGTGYTSRSV